MGVYTHIFQYYLYPNAMFINHMIRVIPQNHNICGQKIFPHIGLSVYEIQFPPFFFYLFYY